MRNTFARARRKTIRPHDLLECLESRTLLTASGKLLPLPEPTGGTALVNPAVVLRPTYQVLSAGNLTPFQTSGPQGFTPSEIRNAYGMNQVSFGAVTGDGTGQTIAIIDAYNDPTIASDLHAFDAAFGLPDPSFRVVAQDGSNHLPAVDPAGRGNNNFEGEEALDVEWAHALAPGASILLVEASNASPSNLFAAVDWARRQAGVSVISMSFGGNETLSETQYDPVFTTPAGHTGVTFIASTGDSGTPAGYPAYSPNVLAAGGTSLALDSLGNYQSETAWSGSGGGISQVEGQPSYQTGFVPQSSSFRTAPDVSFDADPSTGVAVYDSYNNGTSRPWEIIGGTSLAAPAWAGIMAVADQGRVLAGEDTLDSLTGTLPLVYSAPASDFHDVTTGSNGLAARAGYDLVTGRGSPKANLLIPYLVSGTVAPPPPTSGPTIASLSPSAATLAAGSPLTLTAQGVSDPGGTGTAVTFYEETNNVPGLQTGAGGDFAFTPVTDGSNAITLDTTNALGSYMFYAQVTDASGAASPAGTAAPSTTVTVTADTGGTPTVGDIAVNPNPVVSGDALTLTAESLSDPAATIRRVYFYEETNGIPGLQTGFFGDFAFRPVTASSNFSIQLDTTGVTGAVTFYAQAVDSRGNVSPDGSDAPSADVNISSGLPPDAPTALKARAVSSSEIDLSFSQDNSGQNGFTIERADNPAFTNSTRLFTINRPDILTYSDTGLTPGTRYYYRVQAFNDAGTSPFSAPATAITELPATHLAFARQPARVIAGQTFQNPVMVAVRDSHGRTVQNDNSAVQLTLVRAPAGAAVNGATSVQAVSGVATFSDLSFSKAGLYQLSASDDGMRGARSVLFRVVPDASSAHLAIVRQPASGLANTPLTPPLVLQVQDQFGNPVPGGTSAVYVAMVSGPAGGTITGSTRARPLAGVASFPALKLTAPGIYALQAVDANLPVADPVAFSVTIEGPASLLRGDSLHPAGDAVFQPHR